MADFVRYGLERGWWFYPSSLKATEIAPAPCNGVNSRALAFPLEDLYASGEAAGQVGQEVYGAGAALAYATKAFHPLGDGRLLYCEYPARDLKVTPRGASFTVRGAPQGVCAARVIPSESVSVSVDGKKADANRFQLSVGARGKLRW